MIICNLGSMKISFFLSIFVFNFISLALAQDQPISISTDTLVAEDGKVRIYLTLKNDGQRAIYDIQPMIHFHHTMAMISKIAQLEAGVKVVFENNDHPAVLRSGRYPLIIMTQYKTDRHKKAYTQIHIDSFDFREQLESSISGKISTTLNGDESILNIFLKNNSTSFKNIRLMLLLPPGLIADELVQMMGLTIRGGQEKNIKVAVRRKKETPAMIYPVHLLVEYGEMLNHYTGDISGEIDFRSFQERAAIIPALSAIVILLGGLLFRSYFRGRNNTIYSS